ncbi:MAG: type IV pilus twitching motility protein PilT [Candidatus Aureabacteria bacterium]|nr:type IV pilus twitching motility protein PilT [Candidatus Auribacterota bacterium]
MKTDIDTLLRTMVIKKASDLHLQAGRPPIFRIHGDLTTTDLAPLSSEEIEERFVNSIMDDAQKERFRKECHLDLAYSVPGIARFRVNVFRQRGCVGAVMRVIPHVIPTFEELGLPKVINDFAAKPHGLILVTGPTGSGKSTTLAAIIDRINQTERCHIITIEDPIEFLFASKSCLINQRELGRDTKSFGDALRDALREDPDVILVGEMRDLETISNAITAAETGHLVFATLHTNDAAQTVDRIIDVFPPHQQEQIRTQLASTLVGIIAQTLLKRSDRPGRVAAFEILVATTAVRNLIKSGKTHQIYSVLQTGRGEGMQTITHAMLGLIRKGVVSKEEAMSKVTDAASFEEMIGKEASADDLPQSTE